MARDAIARRRNVNLGFRALRAGMPNLPDIERERVVDLLRAEACKPLIGGNRELAHDSLWGDSHLQRELFT
jgi:hypothetical protein